MSAFVVALILAADGPLECPPGTTPKREMHVDYLVSWCVDDDGAWHGPVYGRGVTQESALIGTFRHGVKVGPWLVSDDDGNVKRVDLVDGEDPTTPLVYSDGSRRLEWQFVDEQQTGAMKLWYRGGRQLQRVAHFDAGVPVGTWTWWYRSGAPKASVAFVDGKRHGPYEERFEDGRPRVTGTFDHGHRVGTWTGWSPAGVVAWRFEMVDGCPAGTRRFVEEDVHSTFESCGFGGDRYGPEKPHGFIEQSIGKGRIIGRSVYVDGRQEGFWEGWRPDGSIVLEMFHVHSRFDGPEIWVTIDDRVSRQGNNRCMRRQGIWRGTMDDGAYVEGAYVDDTKHGRWMWKRGAVVRTAVFERGRVVDGPPDAAGWLSEDDPSTCDPCAPTKESCAGNAR